MSSKPENQFIHGVHGQFRTKPYAEKMHNPYRGGTWDVWYSGHKGDYWIEYKWRPHVPKRGILYPDLSELQKDWGLSRVREGRRLAVVVGTPAGGILLTNPQHWLGGIHVTVALGYLMTKTVLADWISEQVGRAYDSSKGRSSGEDGRIVL